MSILYLKYFFFFFYSHKDKLTKRMELIVPYSKRSHFKEFESKMQKKEIGIKIVEE